MNGERMREAGNGTKCASAGMKFPVAIRDGVSFGALFSTAKWNELSKSKPRIARGQCAK